MQAAGPTPVDVQGLFAGLVALHHQQLGGPFHSPIESGRYSTSAQLPAEMKTQGSAVLLAESAQIRRRRGSQVKVTQKQVQPNMQGHDEVKGSRRGHAGSRRGRAWVMWGHAWVMRESCGSRRGHAIQLQLSPMQREDLSGCCEAVYIKVLDLVLYNFSLACVSSFNPVHINRREKGHGRARWTAEQGKGRARLKGRAASGIEGRKSACPTSSKAGRL